MPKTILTTSRLILREFELSDDVVMFELNSDPDVMKYTGDVYFESVEKARELIANYSDYKRNGFGRNTVLLKETSEVLGWCGLKELEDGTVDIGYRFLKKHWNKGYATESAKAIIDYGFKNYGLTEIIGNADADNIGSVRVFEKLGMEFVCKRNYDGIENDVLYKTLNPKLNSPH